MARKTLTYGTLPTREEFDAAFANHRDCPLCGMDAESFIGDGLQAHLDRAHEFEMESRRANPNDPVVAGLRVLRFGNDPRVGTVELTASELWAELEKAQKEWALPVDLDVGPSDEAGQWCSDVLGVLGFEWV